MCKEPPADSLVNGSSQIYGDKVIVYLLKSGYIGKQCFHADFKNGYMGNQRFHADFKNSDMGIQCFRADFKKD